jgi:hypothetical protein
MGSCQKIKLKLPEAPVLPVGGIEGLVVAKEKVNK